MTSADWLCRCHDIGWPLPPLDGADRQPCEAASLRCAADGGDDTRVVNTRPVPAERHRSSRVSTGTVVVMFVVIGTLALLAVFANVQRFRGDHLEKVEVRLAGSPTPQPH